MSREVALRDQEQAVLPRPSSPLHSKPKRLCCGHPDHTSANEAAWGISYPPGCHAPTSRGQRRLRLPRSLLDSCAKKVAESVPFQLVEESFRHRRVPEPAQERIIFWSFPRSERDICMYSSLARVPASAHEYQGSTFHRGIRLVEQGCVRDVLQVGFHLSGEVGVPPRDYSQTLVDSSSSAPSPSHRVSMAFDRCRITSVTCDCGSRDIFWCQHAVALAVHRIRHAERVRLRLPISETLLQLGRSQLQKLVQYLVWEHRAEVLPTAQRLADELLRGGDSSRMNRLEGAPDPTAGAAADEGEAEWHLDEAEVRAQVRAALAQGGYAGAAKQLGAMFSKVRELLLERDSNGPKMLSMMTEQFLSDPRLVLWKSQGATLADKCRQMWDQLGALWVSVALNPTSPPQERQALRWKLEAWASLDMCPPEDPDLRISSHGLEDRRGGRREHHRHQRESQQQQATLGPQNRHHRHGRHHDRHHNHHSHRHQPYHHSRGGSGGGRPRTVLHKALDALRMDWNGQRLRLILTHDGSPPPSQLKLPREEAEAMVDEQGQFVWHEHLPTACARVEALRTHDFTCEAVRLAAAIVRAMKMNQKRAYATWQQQQQQQQQQKEKQQQQQQQDEKMQTEEDKSPVDFHESDGAKKKERDEQRQEKIPEDSKEEQQQQQQQQQQQKQQSHRSPYYANQEGWIGHSLDPIGCLFDTLSEVCLTPEERRNSPHHLDPMAIGSLPLGEAEKTSPSASPPTSTPPATGGGTPAAAPASTSPPSHPPPRYQPHHHHHRRANSAFRSGAVPRGCEPYLLLALEAALIGLGQQRTMPSGLYSQEKASQQEERLISRLQEVEVDAARAAVIRSQAAMLLESGSTSALGSGADSSFVHPPESAPAMLFAKYLFVTLLPHDSDLAFRVGLRAMRLPAHDLLASAAGGGGAGGGGRAVPRWFTLGHIEVQQCALASVMLGAAAKGDIHRLQTVLEVSQRHIRSASHLFKLAQDAFRHALSQREAAKAADTTTRLPVGSNPPPPPPAPPLLKAALQLGLQVTRLTLSSVNWRRREIVRWLVTCAVEAGFEALLSLMRSWSGLFAPAEATGPVATTIMSHATIARLGLSFAEQDELAACARTLALQCANEDPCNCALNALTLCESDPIAFETAYHIVLDAASASSISAAAAGNHHHHHPSMGMSSSQLFTVARYMEHRGCPSRAYRLALLAVRAVSLAHNQETHPAVADVHWACALAHSMGKAELSAMVPLVVKNVQCAVVLSDVLRRCWATAAISPAALTAKAEASSPMDFSPLGQLLDAAMTAFVSTTHSRLSSISPRHYTEFIDFLTKARDTFLLAREGKAKFAQLVENVKAAYKGKKKLVSLINARFVARAGAAADGGGGGGAEG